MAKLKGILLTEGMHGMISQVEGLAKALEIDFTHHTVELNHFWKLIPPNLSPISQSVFKKINHDDFDVIISCGRKSVIPSIHLKKHQIKKYYLLNTILINAVVPLLYHFSHHTTALALLQSLGPEDNYVIRHFKEIGVSPRNAGESQMLLELHGQFCTAKKCLNCAVGTHILVS